MSGRMNRWRGVNLGGWLVLEKWMTPSLFANMQAEDETGWCLQMGAQATTRLQQHWRSFITREDFFWLAEIGINAVRIPIGYWLFAQDYPYHRRFDSQPHPFVTGGDEILAQALDWAEQCGLAVILDLHAVPGCQNGFDNGGMKDICEWHTQIEYREYTLAFLQKLAACYGSHPALWAIEILNEPHWDIASDYLIEYTRLAYQCIRLYCPPERVAVVFHDAFRDYSEYTVLLQDASYQNLILDIHRYQCFTEEDHQRDIFQHIHQATVDRAAEAETLLNCAQRPIILANGV